jgi:hypothetical protein
MIWILIVIVSYLLGSIPSGYLVAKSHGIDIRQHGSKNIGETNVLRVMGKKWGYLVFFCDALKGFVSVKVGFSLAGSFGTTVTLAGLVAALCCILGHNYPVGLQGWQRRRNIRRGCNCLVPGGHCSAGGNRLAASVPARPLRLTCFDFHGGRPTDRGRAARSVCPD